MKNLLTLFAIPFVIASSMRAADEIPPLEFFAGSYRVAGVHPGTQLAYQGLCEIVLKADGHYIMRRVIDGKTVNAKFAIEDHENHEGAKWKVFVARYKVEGETYVITYKWDMANLFVGDNYGLLVGAIARKEEGEPRSTILRGFETLIPTTESAEAFRRELKKEIEELRSEGFGDVDTAVARAVRVFNATSPSGGEQDGTEQPATAPESKLEGRQKPKPESEVRAQ